MTTTNTEVQAAHAAPIPTVPPITVGAMSIDDFCRWAGIGRSLAYTEIAAGRLRTTKVGRRTLVTAEAASTWLAALPDGNDTGNAA